MHPTSHSEVMDVQAKSWLSDCDPYKSTGILRGLAPPLTPMMRRSHPRCATLEPTVTDKGRRGVRRFLDVAAAVDERSSISVSQAGLPSLVRDHAQRQHSPLPRLSPRSPKAPADGYELRQIGDGSWLSIPIPSPVVSPRLSPIRGREAQLSPFLSRQAFVAEYESLTQERRRALGARQAEAAAEAAAAQAARDAAANARAQERRRLMAEVEQMKSQASARVAGMDESGAQSPDSPSRLRGWHEECTTPTGIPRRSASEGKRTARRLSRQRRRAAAQKADEEAGEEARERAAERTGERHREAARAEEVIAAREGAEAAARTAGGAFSPASPWEPLNCMPTAISTAISTAGDSSARGYPARGMRAGKAVARHASERDPAPWAAEWES